MSRNSPYNAEEYRFNDIRNIPANQLFSPASEIADNDNFDARQHAQKLVETDYYILQL